ncbi:unnamed protein product [Effrenium voratum]|uniref:Uncharacterized protein n=1 Tax=Effrenium voratum TaxID=2562239 RepID=A0AA36IZ39_9DINO|nr:unnamed protein product [Effrenium voratum]
MRSSKPLLLSNKAEARQVLGEAITKVSELAMQLEDAILAAFDAGLEEDELLPAFARLEELRRGVACC